MRIERGVVIAYDSTNHEADVGLVGSMQRVALAVPVSHQVGAELMGEGTACCVLFYGQGDAGGVVVATFDGAPDAWVTEDLLAFDLTQFERADKDGDGEMEPYWAAAWAPKTLSNGASGTIDWETDFGLPEQPKMVWLYLLVNDSGSANKFLYIKFQGKSTTTRPSLVASAETGANDVQRPTHGPAPVAADGTTYYYAKTSGASTMDVLLHVVGWIA